MAENKYTVINVSNETKDRFEEARKKVPYEKAQTADDFLNYLLESQENKKGK